MKKLSIFLIILCLITGCNKKETSPPKVTEEKIKKEIKEDLKYIDQNNTPIGIYNNNKKLETYSTTLTPLNDINIFQIYPSNDDFIPSNVSFSQSFYNEFKKYKANNPNLKIGFNIKFTNEKNEKISFNILNPETTIGEYSEYILVYLYDDYINQGKSFYSHLETSDYNENSLFTSIKLQAGGNSYKIKSNIELSVFTYDTEDDFENNEYLGNSISTITIQTN